MRLGSLNCFPLRAEWERRRPLGGAVRMPSAEHTSRDGWPDGFAAPLGARRLVVTAERYGWQAGMTYARGPWQPKNRPVRTVHSVAVRMSRSSGRWAVAVYHCPVEGERKWTCEMTMVARGVHGVFSACSVTDLAEWLEAAGEVPEDWYEAIRERGSAAKARNAEKAKARPKKAREDVS